MDIAFNAASLLFTFATGLLYYGLAGWLPVRGVFSKSLAGLLVAALPVAILVNFNAHLASQLQFYIFIVSSSLTIYLLIKHVKKNTLLSLCEKLYSTFFLLLVGITIIFFNNPLNLYLTETINGTIFNHHSHYGYLSSPMLEVQRAEYNDRIRLFGIYPGEWTKYHFFNNMVLGGLVVPQTPVGIFSYFSAQATFFALSFLVICEKIYSTQISIKKTTAIALILILITISWYYKQIQWMYFTSGGVSTIAIFLFIYSLHKQRLTESVIWLALYSIATIRDVPIGGGVLLYLLITNRKTFFTLNRIIKLQIFSIFALVGTYLVVTLTTGQLNAGTQIRLHLNGTIYSDGWAVLSPFHNGWGTTLNSWGFPWFQDIAESLNFNFMHSWIAGLSWLVLMGLFISPVIYNKFSGKNVSKHKRRQIIITYLGIPIFVLSGILGICIIVGISINPDVAKIFLACIFPIAIILIYPHHNRTRRVTIVLCLLASISFLYLPYHIGTVAFQTINIVLLAMYIAWLTEQKSKLVLISAFAFCLSLALTQGPIINPWGFLSGNHGSTIKIVLDKKLLSDMSKDKDKIWCGRHKETFTLEAHALISGVRLAFLEEISGPKSLNFLHPKEKMRMTNKPPCNKDNIYNVDYKPGHM